MTQSPKHGGGGGGVLPVMGTAQSGRIFQIGKNIFARHQRAIAPADICITGGRNAANLLARCMQCIGNSAAFIVITPDDGGGVRRQHIEKTRFGRDISGHVAMPVEVVGS